MNFPEEILNKKNAEKKDGVFYFFDVPKDIRPSDDVDAQDQEKWSFWRKENFLFFKRELVNFPEDKILVDLGAGQSDFAELTGRFKKCAVDFYPYKDVDVVCDFSLQLPFIDNSVDIILLSNVLEHMPEPRNLISECRRILKPGGVILGSVPFLIGVHQRPYDFYRYTDIGVGYIFKQCWFPAIKIERVARLDILFKTVSAKFFHVLITRSVLAKNKFLNFACVSFLKIVWIFIRVLFAVLSPLFKKIDKERDWPLGYLFRAEKV